MYFRSSNMEAAFISTHFRDSIYARPSLRRRSPCSTDHTNFNRFYFTCFKDLSDPYLTSTASTRLPPVPVPQCLALFLHITTRLSNLYPSSRLLHVPLLWSLVSTSWHHPQEFSYIYFDEICAFTIIRYSTRSQRFTKHIRTHSLIYSPSTSSTPSK